MLCTDTKYKGHIIDFYFSSSMLFILSPIQKSYFINNRNITDYFVNVVNYEMKQEWDDQKQEKMWVVFWALEALSGAWLKSRISVRVRNNIKIWGCFLSTFCIFISPWRKNKKNGLLLFDTLSLQPNIMNFFLIFDSNLFLDCLQEKEKNIKEIYKKDFYHKYLNLDSNFAFYKLVFLWEYIKD